MPRESIDLPNELIDSTGWLLGGTLPLFPPNTSRRVVVPVSCRLDPRRPRVRLDPFSRVEQEIQRIV